MLLQRLEAGIDHVRIAAQVGDVALGIRCELGQRSLHIAMADVGVRMRGSRIGQLAREARHEAELRLRVGEGTELIAVEEFFGRARALQQHHFDATRGDQRLDQRQHRPVRRHPGAGPDQQVAAVGVVGQQAEAPERSTGVDRSADRQALEQGGRRAARDITDRDLHRFAGGEGVVVLGRQRIAAARGGAVGVGEVDLDELAGDVIQRLAVVAQERQVGDGGRDHPARRQLQREMDDGQALRCSVWWVQRRVARCPAGGRLY